MAAYAIVLVGSLLLIFFALINCSLGLLICTTTLLVCAILLLAVDTGANATMTFSNDLCYNMEQALFRAAGPQYIAIAK